MPTPDLQLPTLLLLGLIAGATIFIGLPVGRMQRLLGGTCAALSMLAAGVLLYLMIEILGEATGQTTAALRADLGAGALLVLALMLGLLAGFVGLVAVEQRLIRTAKGESATQLSYMIATGIGVHNLSEGLAIGQTFAQGRVGLSVGLIVGFALHNATEGFGIVGPSLCGKARLPWKTLLTLGLIGGGPTFVGTLLGSLWTNAAFNVFVLALAGGAILYVLKELFAGVRREARQYLMMSAVILGFAAGWGTGAVASAAGSEGGSTVAADGDVIAVLPPSRSVSPAVQAVQNDLAREVLAERALAPTVLPDGTRRYVLTASAFAWEVAPGRTVTAWGYNGQVPGPLLRLRVGERVEVVLKNALPQATTVHWHGLAVPEAMDGMPMSERDAVPPGASFTYRFTVTPQMIGTHYYHSHFNDDFQVDQGLHGALIVDPAGSPAPGAVDALYELSSFKVGSEGENFFAFDGKAYPNAPALTVRRGERVRLRFINASAEESHVLHLHGYTFQIVAQDGNALKAPISANTVLLAPSQTADVVFTATHPGTWMLQCHIMDHAINPGPQGDGNATVPAERGGLISFVRVLSAGAPLKERTATADTLMSASMPGMTMNERR